MCGSGDQQNNNKIKIQIFENIENYFVGILAVNHGACIVYNHIWIMKHVGTLDTFPYRDFRSCVQMKHDLMVKLKSKAIRKIY